MHTRPATSRTLPMLLLAAAALVTATAARAAEDPTNRATFAPWANRGLVEDVTGAEPAPVAGAKTWKLTKTGGSSQWNGWEGTYGGTFSAAPGEFWTISGYYKTSAAAGIPALYVGGIYKPDWSGFFKATIVQSSLAIVPDGAWHFFYATLRADEAITNGIIHDGPSWGYSTAAGVLFIHGLQWTRTRFPVPGPGDATNRATFAPWTNGGRVEDVTETEHGPIFGAKTWKLTKTGGNPQWNGWEGTYGGTFSALPGEYWTVSGYYRTTAAAGVASLNVSCLYKPDWSGCFDTTLVDARLSIIADGNWHSFHATLRANETIANGIIVDGPSWGYSSSAGVLYVHGLQWTKTRYVVPYPGQKNYAVYDPTALDGGLVQDVSTTAPGPVPGARTWRLEKTGGTAQWNGWQGRYRTPLSASPGESWTISGYYKTTSAAGQTAFLGAQLSDGRSIYPTTTVDSNLALVPDGEWHYFHVTIRANQAILDPVLLSAPVWNSSTAAGVLYVNGLRWTRDGGLPTCAPFAAQTDLKVSPGWNPHAAIVNLRGLDPTKVQGFQVLVKGQGGGKDYVRTYYPDDAIEWARWGTPDVSFFPNDGFHVPVVGLYRPVAPTDPERVNDVRVLVNVSSAGCYETALQVRTSPPTQPLPTIRTSTAAPERMEPGWTFGQVVVDPTAPNQGDGSIQDFAFDERGALRWSLGSFPGQSTPRRTQNGTFLTSMGSQIVEFTELGRGLRVIDQLDYVLGSDVQQLPSSGNMLLMARLANASTWAYQERVLELEWSTGKVVGSWDLNRVLDSSRYSFASTWTNMADWFHAAGVAYSAKDDAVVVSGRKQGVAKLARGGNLLWLLAPHRGWKSPQAERLLTAVDARGVPYAADVQDGAVAAADGFDWPFGQHAPVLLANGDLMLFDNGTNRHFQDGCNPSRVVVYRVDEAARTVRQVSQYALGAAQSSCDASNAARLPVTGNLLVQSGMTPSNTAILKELAPDGTPVFEAEWDLGKTVPPRPSYSDHALRQAF